jgi:DNA-binding MarR family transcriptional regulator
MSAGPVAVLDFESRAAHHDHAALRLWLRLVTCNVMVERTLRARLRERFGITLARFDYLSQLERARDGLRMQELSRRLMVTGGNVTGLTRELVREGLVERRTPESDRRVQMVRLTARGRRAFAGMARAHEAWVVELLGELPAHERDALYAALGRLKRALAHRAGRTEIDDPAAAAAAAGDELEGVST